MAQSTNWKNLPNNVKDIWRRILGSCFCFHVCWTSTIHVWASSSTLVCRLIATLLALLSNFTSICHFTYACVTHVTKSIWQLMCETAYNTRESCNVSLCNVNSAVFSIILRTLQQHSSHAPGGGGDDGGVVVVVRERERARECVCEWPCVALAGCVWQLSVCRRRSPRAAVQSPPAAISTTTQHTLLFVVEAVLFCWHCVCVCVCVGCCFRICTGLAEVGGGEGGRGGGVGKGRGGGLQQSSGNRSSSRLSLSHSLGGEERKGVGGEGGRLWIWIYLPKSFLLLLLLLLLLFTSFFPPFSLFPPPFSIFSLSHHSHSVSLLSLQPLFPPQLYWFEIQDLVGSISV